MKHANLVVYEFRRDNCGREFFRLMPDDEFYYEPTKEEESQNNLNNRELLKQALDQKYGVFD